MLTSAKWISAEISHSEEELLQKFWNKDHPASERKLEERIMYCILGKKRISKAII